MKQEIMYDVQEVKHLIGLGKPLLIAGDEQVLRELPPGNWIGGTSPYFMTEDRCLFTQEKVCVTRLPEYVTDTSVRVYDEKTLADVYTDSPENGFSFIIIPGLSRTHLSFALNAPNYKGFATRPLIGWISGISEEGPEQTVPRVFSGQKGDPLEEGAVVMHVHLPANKAAEISLFNLFEQGDGDEITFSEDGFKAATAQINGETVNIAEYMLKNKLDTKLPLVADYYGTMINTSIREIDERNGQVRLYAPVFKNVAYRHARPVGDYVTQFTARMSENDVSGQLVFSCNCFLNYLYSELEGKTLQGFTGPITFGEIAYQLLNQTMTCLTIEDI
ncbi:hypothetical protein DENIS_0378 [Desulfonema ishimotonii]|uniref:Uncharacterized protein n=1 Tax=Desulfonema ishimotonii TaxID=45657 RepID=A0A401FR50_9BACT|nr:hypothetical protein [Desulfonema ishimotonii]GBC59439.1 hypothetical protein DENIS_0378 [Desulfonema ishimotonii]